MGNCSLCYLRRPLVLIPLAFRNAKNSKIIKITLLQAFCPLKTEIARFPIGFRLIIRANSY